MKGFNAIIGTLERGKQFDAVAIDVINRDADFRHRITGTCREAWARKHAPRKI